MKSVVIKVPSKPKCDNNNKIDSGIASSSSELFILHGRIQLMRYDHYNSASEKLELKVSESFLVRAELSNSNLVEQELFCWLLAAKSIIYCVITHLRHGKKRQKLLKTW